MALRFRIVRNGSPLLVQHLRRPGQLGNKSNSLTRGTLKDSIQRVPRVSKLPMSTFPPPHLAKPFIHESLSCKSLFFSIQDVQSKMHILRPDELLFEYTRLMMGFLLFNPRPKRILMIGLGGGSLVKFCHRHLPGTRITVVEVNPHVVSLRNDFAIPNDDARLSIVLDDAADFVADTRETFDVIFADGFDISGLPPQLSSVKFYSDCKSVLKPGGILVANLHRNDRLFDVYLDRMQSVFDAPLLKVDDPGGSNSVAFGFKYDVAHTVPSLRLRRPDNLDESAWNSLFKSLAHVFLNVRTLERLARSQKPLHA